MEPGEITGREIAEALLPLLDDDIAAVAREEEMRAEREAIDRLIEEAEREWAVADRTESDRVPRFTDKRRARRTNRRVGRSVLRTLPVSIDGGVATARVRSMPDLDGEGRAA
jgi:SpoVK/Ycf46/Vps4 family AAA+-type ATPase